MPTSSYKYETVAISQTGQALGLAGAQGDIIKKLIINVSAAATSTVTILDGATSISLMAATTPIGTYTVDFGEQGLLSQSGAWSITTGAGASVIAIGDFT